MGIPKKEIIDGLLMGCLQGWISKKGNFDDYVSKLYYLNNSK
jgi:hypothetical protein